MSDIFNFSREQLTEGQASKIYGYSRSWFQKKRWEGGGPPYRKIGRSVRYPAKSTAEFFESFRIQNSTSEGV